jgi:hypothetical protein
MLQDDGLVSVNSSVNPSVSSRPDRRHGLSGSTMASRSDASVSSTGSLGSAAAANPRSSAPSKVTSPTKAATTNGNSKTESKAPPQSLAITTIII